MKHSRIVIGLLTILLVACQQEEPYTGPCDVRFRAYLQDEVTVSRAYTAMPTDYADFAAGLFVSNGTQVNTTTMVKEGTTLTAALRLEEGEYYIYGYLPQADGADLTFDAADNTATMTIPNIAGLSTTDALVIRKGDKLTITTDDKTKIAPLLMDHLMAKVTPSFYIDSEYAKMRSIRIKKVEFALDGATTYTANVTFDNAASPISWSSSWTPGTTSDMKVVTYQNDEPTEADTLTCTKGEQTYGECYLCPAQSVENLQMTVTYDVYDTEGQRVRLDAKATNAILKLKEETLEPGKNYKLNIKIVPTYLYVLSDNDEESLVVND